MRTITITVHLTDDEALWLGQIVDMTNAAQAVAYYKANRQLRVWPEARLGVDDLHGGHVRPPVVKDEAAALEAVRSAKAKVPEALEAASVEVPPPG
jgi:hypothetical protein